MNALGKKPCRIVFGATCFADASSALSTAIDIAKIVDGKIEAYLLEDEAIASFMAYPSARIISMSGRSSEPATADYMKKAYQRDASIFEQTLSHAASKATIDWSFKKREGSLHSFFIWKNTKDADYILFGYQQLVRQTGSGVLVIQTKDEPNDQLLDMAEIVAKPLNLDVNALQIDYERKQTGKIDPTLKSASDVLNFVNDNSFTILITSKGIVEQIGLDALVNACRCPVLISNY